MPPLSSLRIAVAAVALLVPPVGKAMAQEDGVRVDPDSPAGKEYALPLDSARRDAAGTGGAAGGGDDAAPLFGAGISKRGSQRATEGEQAGSGGEAGLGSASDASGDGEPGASRTADAVADTASSGLSAGLLTALVALGVLAAGGLVGLLLRARGAHQPR